ncbi:hypothetical protein C0Q44_17500 [Paenibacillus sp. PCH8]|uniref:hypothetical protein n=1 Tax=Paenibacillus sp. PCH8 TaxID=2066524 RepID=UPI000CFA3321|nr:hypothetical protein [Paenibacillus sp. PCH8]PQP81518.1 hypothetical protein C0Q44_17500 [Paenibacillus sp. PCH8]
MAKTNEIRAKAIRYRGRPVCVTLHNGETYIGYISGVSSGDVVLTGVDKLSNGSTSGGSTRRTKSRAKAAPASKSASSVNRKRVNGINKSSKRTRVTSRATSRQAPAQVSSFMPMMGSLLGGLGGGGSLGGMLGGGMRLFGMIQQFVPVVKMGYGMIKQIQPFMGAVQGLMAPSAQGQAAQAEAETGES